MSGIIKRGDDDEGGIRKIFESDRIRNSEYEFRLVFAIKTQEEVQRMGVK